MADNENNPSLDFLGIKPIGEAFNTTVVKTFQGVEGFLRSVCVPALDEVGLLLKDKIRYWRLNNVLRILEKAKGKLEFKDDQLQIQAHPRVALSIIENGSLNDNDEVQELWAGLFASSCTTSGQDDENLIFVDLLKQLTVAEARILKYSSENAKKIVYPFGLVLGDSLNVDCETLMKISGIKKVHRLDRELDHLRSLELIGSSPGSGGFNVDYSTLVADISPTSLALNLYIKGQGKNIDPIEYWHDQTITIEQKRIEENEKQRLKNGTD